MACYWDAVGAAVRHDRQRLRLQFQRCKRIRNGKLFVGGAGNVILLLDEFVGRIVLPSCENIVLLSERPTFERALQMW